MSETADKITYVHGYVTIADGSVRRAVQTTYYGVSATVHYASGERRYRANPTIEATFRPRARRCAR